MTAALVGSGSGRWRRHTSRLAALVLFVVAAGIGFAGPAAAHNVLIGSDPADGATLQSAPTTVRLTFDQPVQDFQPVLAVIGPDDQHFESGTPQVDSTVVTAPVSALPAAGPYVIAYRVVSADGHPVVGEVHFQLAEAAESQPSPASAATPSASAGQAFGTAPASETAAPTPTASDGTPASSNPANPASASTTAAAVANTAGSSGLSGWVWAAVAVAAILVIAAVVVIVRRPRQPD